MNINRRNALIGVVSSFGLVMPTSKLLAREIVVDRRLLGKWRSDVEKSMAFNDESAKLTEPAKKVLRQILGKMTVEYGEREYVMEMEGYTLTGANGRVVEMEAWRERVPYTVLDLTEHTVAIKHSPFKAAEIDLLHFEDEYFWIYSDINHTREYFKRVN